jgi:protein TonB
VRRSIVASGVAAILLHGFVLFGLHLDRPALPLPPEPGPIVVGLVASAPQPAAVPAPPEPQPERPSVPEPPKAPREDRPAKKPVIAPKPSKVAAPEPAAEQAPPASASGAGSAAPSPSNGATAAGGVVSSLPRYRNTPAPSYPPAARREHQEGVVLLSVDVGPNGRPTRVVLKKSSGVPILDQAAAAAVRRWTFEPARTAGLPIESTVEVPVRFSLAD